MTLKELKALKGAMKRVSFYRALRTSTFQEDQFIDDLALIIFELGCILKHHFPTKKKHPRN